MGKPTLPGASLLFDVVVTESPRANEQYVYDLLSGFLEAEIEHVDGKRQQGQFDALIKYPGGQVAALEVTAPPAHEEQRTLARAGGRGELQSQGGSRHYVPDLGLLPIWTTRQLSQGWASANIEKLRASGLSERHLALRLLDSDGIGLAIEVMDAQAPPAEDPEVPDALTDLWIVGTGRRVVRWSRGQGWSLHEGPRLTKGQRDCYRSLEESGRASRRRGSKTG